MTSYITDAKQVAAAILAKPYFVATLQHGDVYLGWDTTFATALEAAEHFDDFSEDMPPVFKITEAGLTDVTNAAQRAWCDKHIGDYSEGDRLPPIFDKFEDLVDDVRTANRDWSRHIAAYSTPSM